MARTTIFTETESELLKELIETPAWGVFLRKIVKLHIRQSTMDALNKARQGAAGAYPVGQIDGIKSVINGLYIHNGITPPDLEN